MPMRTRSRDGAWTVVSFTCALSGDVTALASTTASRIAGRIELAKDGPDARAPRVPRESGDACSRRRARRGRPGETHPVNFTP